MSARIPESSDNAAASAADLGVLDTWLDAVWMEKGLSRNTLASYRSDLLLFAGWLAGRQSGLLGASRLDVLDYLAARLQQGVNARSTSRLLSCLRGFYRQQLRDGLIAVDPTLRITSPKLGRPLPKSLTEDDVDRLLAAPDVTTPLGLRDRTMLEVLYATGLRVTELVTLTLPQLGLRQ